MSSPRTYSRGAVYLIGLASAALLGLVFFSGGDDDIQKHASVVDRLRLLSQLDAQLRQDILKLRFGYMLDYDSVATSMAASKKVLSGLRKGPGAIHGKGSAELDQKIEALDVLFKNEEETLASFSSENTTLNNSLRYFPSLTTKFIEKARDTPEMTALGRKVEKLLQNILLFSYAEDNTAELALEIERYLTEVESAVVPALLSSELDMIRGHTKIILAQKTEMQGIMGRLLASHATTAIDGLSQRYFAEHELISQKNAFNRHLLFALCLLLILIVTETVARLKERTKALDEMNLTLEKRVDDRTRELKKSESSLREREQRLRLIYDFSPLGICLTDALGECTFSNPAYSVISGLSEKEVAGRGWESVMHPEDRDRIIKEWYQAAKDHRPYEDTFRYLRKNGTVVWVHVVSAPLGQADEAAGYVGMVEDITEKKKLEAQLLQSQKMETVGTLAGGIAHDLNNQMTPLRGYLDILLQDLKSDPDKYPMVLEASQSAIRCSEIVKRLLNFSKPSSPEDKNVIRIPDLLNEMKRMFHSLLPATIKTEVHFEENLPTVYGNETELQTVLMNLTTNARDAMPKGGTLRIEAKSAVHAYAHGGKREGAGAHLAILVTDSGQGISSEIISKIFEPFFSTKEKSKGAGLGLAMVFGIIKSHHGSINVSSVVGRGTTFEIYLPAHDDNVEPVKQAPSPAQASAANLRGDETILFVDDEKSLRDLGKTILERLGYKTLMASDGEEAVEIYREKRSDIAAVLMDMTMPKLTGRETMERLLKVNPKLKIILATGFTTEGSTQELIAAGAKDLIQKPYTASTIAQKLRTILDQ